MGGEIEFDEDQLDLLKETFNIGVGQAAGALSELAGDLYEVELSIPSARLIPIRRLADELSGGTVGEVCAVTQQYEGVLPGTAILLYPEKESLALVRLMLGADHAVEEMSELASDALCEVGNILLNCIPSAAFGHSEARG
jgi:chemotaxis protein CheC